MNMDSEKQVVDNQMAAMREKNERDRSKVDSLYLTRKQKEDDAARTERDIEKVTFTYDSRHFRDCCVVKYFVLNEMR